MPSTTQQAITSKAESSSLINRLWSLIGQLLGANLPQEKLRLTVDNQHLRDEIAMLKGEKAKPKFKPSGMEKKTEPKSITDDKVWYLYADLKAYRDTPPQTQLKFCCQILPGREQRLLCHNLLSSY